MAAAETRAVVSCSEATIQEFEIARLRRDRYGISSERRARRIDQVEIQLEELETAITEDALAAEQTTEKASTVRTFTRHLVHKPFPGHPPRARVVVEAPAACSRCGSDQILKMGGPPPVSLIVTAKMNDIDPKTWLADVLARLSDTPVARIHELLPWNWTQSLMAKAA